MTLIITVDTDKEALRSSLDIDSGIKLAPILHDFASLMSIRPLAMLNNYDLHDKDGNTVGKVVVI